LADGEGGYIPEPEVEYISGEGAQGEEPAEAAPAPATITAFADLPASVVSQTVPFGTELAALDLPTALTATTDALEDYTITVPVSWSSAPEFEGFAGEYIFTAAVQGDFVVADGVEPPVIAVTVEPIGIMP